MMTNDEIRVVLDADDAGKDIQYSDDKGTSWNPKGSMWNFVDLLYRVKPVGPVTTNLDIHTYKDAVQCLPTGTTPSGLRGSDTCLTRKHVEFIEVTEEVRATLTEKGILKC